MGTVTKGKVLRGDLNQYDGTLAKSRVSSSGGTAKPDIRAGPSAFVLHPRAAMGTIPLAIPAAVSAPAFFMKLRRLRKWSSDVISEESIPLALFISMATVQILIGFKPV